MKVAFFALAATSFLGLAARPSSLIKKTPKERFNDVSSNLNLKIENFSSANPPAKNRIAVATTIDEFDFVNFKEESSTGLFDYGDLNSFTKNSAHNLKISDFNLYQDPNLLLAQDGDVRNFITRAAEQGKIEIIKLILEKNPDLLKVQDKNGYNAMTMAVHFGPTEIIKLILEQYKGLSKWDTVKLLRYPAFSYNLYQLNPKKYNKLFLKLIILKLLSLVLMKMIYKILHDMSEKNKIRTIYKKINQQDISEFKDSVGNINTHQVKNLVFQFLDLKKDNQISDEEWKAITQFYKVCANGDYASFFGECPLSFADWIEIDNPVLSLGKHYEEEMLQRCQRGNGVHPLTNKKQPIIYYIDEAFQTLKREINDSIVKNHNT